MQRMIDRLWAGRGRVRRGKFWLFVVILIFFPYALMSVLTDTLGWDTFDRSEFSGASRGQLLQLLWERDRLQFAITLAVQLITSLLFFALCIGRRRDRDQPGVEIIPFALVAITLPLLPVEGEAFALFLGLPVLIWGLVLLVPLGLLKGTEGPNRYGPDPIEPDAPAPSPTIFE